jgi:hypothetical protein
MEVTFWKQFAQPWEQVLYNIYVCANVYAQATNFSQGGLYAIIYSS